MALMAKLSLSDGQYHTIDGQKLEQAFPRIFYKSSMTLWLAPQEERSGT
ncbi:predicted protein [Sclerotinia sclerotiorum 1980 UF-70]|uniref:Uncharacterized protein n=1 Tax=Sclerotinia sclerotiorum (strain ATCC 18683 / 1980 / Ss-1) TaxID=665079 RepID=A7EKX8_SCLS1|nr:predicted protein [Sclerotinia sclerotiorum 1980 UF-70]EDO03494.1 predicted protein [Sclerotinia sclerotiorum 1980 UF-70]